MKKKHLLLSLSLSLSLSVTYRLQLEDEASELATFYTSTTTGVFHIKYSPYFHIKGGF